MSGRTKRSGQPTEPTQNQVSVHHSAGVTTRRNHYELADTERLNGPADATDRRSATPKAMPENTTVAIAKPIRRAPLESDNKTMAISHMARTHTTPATTIPIRSIVVNSRSLAMAVPTAP